MGNGLTIAKIIGFIILVASQSTFAVAPSSDPLRVQYLQVEINGAVHRLMPGEDLVLISGDELKIGDALLSDLKKKPDYINLIGYTHKDKPKFVDDRQVVIHSDRDLDASWSVAKPEEVYRMRVYKSGKQLSEFMVRVLKPEIRYVAMEVNGKRQVLRPGEITRFKGKDQFKVTEVATNVENDDLNVSYEIQPISARIPGADHVSFYEIKFSRRGKVFARLPLQIEN